VLIPLFIIGWIPGSGTDFQQKTNAENNSTNEPALEPADSSATFTAQEFKYHAPRSASVFLIWKAENHPLKEAVLWNAETKFKDEYLCNPMPVSNDTFSIRLKVPKNSMLEYYFWITKNKQGHYQDFWDVRSGGKIFANEHTPVIKTANYSKEEALKRKSVTDFGWMLLLLFASVYLMLHWIGKKWIKRTNTPSATENVIFVGISLWGFHMLARSEIININLKHIIYNWRLIPQLIRGSTDDLLFVSAFVLFFVLVLWPAKKPKVKNLILGIFILLAMIATLAAFVNITTVIYFGKPFTYQWLYYSDFLGSNEARTAFQENLDWGIILNLVALIFSMLIFAGILQKLYSFFAARKTIKIFTYPVIALAAIVLTIYTFKAEAHWTKGQADNAIKAMSWSMLTANLSHSFFTAELSDDLEPFNPRDAVPMDSPIEKTENHATKNILIIVLESAGAVYFDDYGGTFQLSPNLSKYSGQATVFEQMYAHAPATNRSLVSVLGSMYPYLSYKSLTQEAPAVNHPTISSELKNKGYRTSFFSTADLSFQNCKQFLDNRGFDVIEDYAAITCAEEFHLDNPDYLQGNGKDDMCLAERLKTWLDEDTTRNFFSMMWTVQGHYPYFFGKEEEDFGVSEVNYNRYLNCLKYNDELVGNVMRLLEERKLEEKTLVVIFGDHGEAFGQHGQYGHATALYEENIKIPLYFINPVLFYGERKNDIAGMKDLATTIFAIIGEDSPPVWQGRNLLTTNSFETFSLAPWSDYLFGYRHNNMKFIFNETRNSVEVFDLSSDPKETVNLAQSLPESELEFARNRIAAWVQFQDKFVRELLQNEK
ncbi:MAG: LTA synthase family protein, partial [Mariniphaga sp.]